MTRPFSPAEVDYRIDLYADLRAQGLTVAAIADRAGMGRQGLTAFLARHRDDPRIANAPAVPVARPDRNPRLGHVQQQPPRGGACVGQQATFDAAAKVLERKRPPTSQPHPDVAYAVGICRGCPVKNECLTYALDVDDAWGVLGGTTPLERRRMRRRPR